MGLSPEICSWPQSERWTLPLPSSHPLSLCWTIHVQYTDQMKKDQGKIRMCHGDSENGAESLTNEKIFSLKGVLRAVLCEQCTLKHQKQTDKYLMAILGSGDKVHGSQHGGSWPPRSEIWGDEVLRWYESFSKMDIEPNSNVLSLHDS